MNSKQGHVTPTIQYHLDWWRWASNWASLKILDPHSDCLEFLNTQIISLNPQGNTNFPIPNTMIWPFFVCGCSGFLLVFGLLKKHILHSWCDRLRFEGKARFQWRRGWVEMWSNRPQSLEDGLPGRTVPVDFCPWWSLFFPQGSGFK